MIRETIANGDRWSLERVTGGDRRRDVLVLGEIEIELLPVQSGRITGELTVETFDPSPEPTPAEGAGG